MKQDVIPESNIIKSLTNSVFQGYQNVFNRTIFKKSESPSPEQSPIHKTQPNNDNIKSSIKNIFGGFKSFQESMIVGNNDDNKIRPKIHQFSLPEIDVQNTVGGKTVEHTLETIDIKHEPELKLKTEDTIVGERRMSGKILKLTSRAQTMQEANTMMDTLITEPRVKTGNDHNRNKLEKRYSDESTAIAMTNDDTESFSKTFPCQDDDQIDSANEQGMKTNEIKDYHHQLQPLQTLDVDDQSKSSSRR
ncbi:hypothetical protein BLA29_009777, partial [Euroglyphus maynei]